MEQAVVEVRQKKVLVESFTKYFWVTLDDADATQASVTEVRPAITDTLVGAAITKPVDVVIESIVDLGGTEAFQSLGERIWMTTGSAPNVYGVMRKL
jgi:hypothetical protein